MFGNIVLVSLLGVSMFLAQAARDAFGTVGLIGTVLICTFE